MSHPNAAQLSITVTQNYAKELFFLMTCGCRRRCANAAPGQPPDQSQGVKRFSSGVLRRLLARCGFVRGVCDKRSEAGTQKKAVNAVVNERVAAERAAKAAK